MTKKFSHSVRKYVARQKALIRARVFDVKKQEEAIAELRKKVSAPAEPAAPVAAAKKEKNKAKAK